MTNLKSHVRAFFALDLPVAMKKRIALGIVKPLRQQFTPGAVRWTEENNLHVTLQFLGMLKLEDVEPLTTLAINQLKNFSPFTIDLGPLELFPDAQKPKLISLAVNSEENQLVELVKKLEQVIKGLNYPVEERPFRGHLTVGRLSHFDGERIDLSTLCLLEKIRIDRVTLFQSSPHEKGSRYTSLANIKFN